MWGFSFYYVDILVFLFCRSTKPPPNQGKIAVHTPNAWGLREHKHSFSYKTHNTKERSQVTAWSLQFATTNGLQALDLSLRMKMQVGKSLSLRVTVQYNTCTVYTMVFWPGGTAYVPQKQFWIIALPSLYSMISHAFPLAASFSNSVNTMEENGNSWQGSRLACFWHQHSKHFYLPTAEITARSPGKIRTHTPVAEG